MHHQIEYRQDIWNDRGLTMYSAWKYINKKNYIPQDDIVNLMLCLNYRNRKGIMGFSRDCIQFAFNGCKSSSLSYRDFNTQLVCCLKCARLKMILQIYFIFQHFAACTFSFAQFIFQELIAYAVESGECGWQEEFQKPAANTHMHAYHIQIRSVFFSRKDCPTYARWYYSFRSYIITTQGALLTIINRGEILKVRGRMYGMRGIINFDLVLDGRRKGSP